MELILLYIQCYKYRKASQPVLDPVVVLEFKYEISMSIGTLPVGIGLYNKVLCIHYSGQCKPCAKDLLKY